MSALVALLKKLETRENTSLAPFSTLKVGGYARYFVVCHNEEELCLLQRACNEHTTNLHIISGGSNTLFSDQGFDGVVVKLGPSFDYINQEATGLNLCVGAASSFAKLTKIAVNLGWTHAVGWSGTPGLVGGALRMNAGTRLGEIKDAVNRIYGIQDGRAVVFEQKDIKFSYRASNLPTNLIITRADLAYDKNQLRPVADLLQQVQEYRLKRKASQPSTASAGSFFKNPHPLFAAQLIENCSLKGSSYKSAQISPLHANFIVNNGGATAEDILHIAGTAQKAVWDKFGVMLKPEIRLVGTFGEDLPLCI
jgi:UDP-N-acetylmuramate dehydrogenase